MKNMRFGLCVPQGYFNEYDGWDPVKAWKRTLEVSELGARLGFESIWTGEHVTSKWGGPGSTAFDVWVMTTAIAALVPKVEIGFSVLNSTFSNPALTAKRAATLDVITDGRVVLGLGAGFRQIEADTFGFEYPGLGERLAILNEHFEIVTRALNHDEPPFSFEGAHARVQNLDNAPRGVRRPRVKIMVAGRGPKLTFPMAAKYADIFNLGVESPELPEMLDLFHQTCERVGRDPSTIELQGGLNPSVAYKGQTNFYGQRMMGLTERAFASADVMENLGSRIEEMHKWAEAGCDEFVVTPPGLHNSDESLYELVDEIKQAGFEFPRAGWGERSNEPRAADWVSPALASSGAGAS
jgi:alkanesulfonate monooxygenase SsuD/methylene tetrahydromethanopterin reductase-like flavin-dependent oxidoreductase (luciferase family)